MIDKDNFLHLTEPGQEIVEKIFERHQFFRDHLIAVGVSPDVAGRDSCKIEHVINDESFQKLKKNSKI